MSETPKVPITLHLADGSDMTVDVTEIDGFSVGVMDVTPTPAEWRQFEVRERVVKLKDGRTLLLRADHP